MRAVLLLALGEQAVKQKPPVPSGMGSFFYTSLHCRKRSASSDRTERAAPIAYTLHIFAITIEAGKPLSGHGHIIYENHFDSVGLEELR